MDHRGFDTWTRSLTTRDSRRGALRRLGLAGAMATLLVRGEDPVSASHCTHEGCGCATGTHHTCAHGLVCCPRNPGTPGSAGICRARGHCGRCTGYASRCASYCKHGAGCAHCCTGFCNHRGRCDNPPNLNATCTGGTHQPCRYSLVCCPYVRDLPGGAGTCEYSC